MVGHYCVVPGCKNRFYRVKANGQAVSFHKLPVKRRAVLLRWLAALRRKSPPSFSRVCSEHFLEEDYKEENTFESGRLVVRRTNRLKPGVVPSVFSTHSGTEASVTHTEARNDDEEEHNFSNLNEGESFGQVSEVLHDHDYLQVALSMEDQIKAAMKQIAHLEKVNQNLRSETFCLQRFQCEPKLIMFYTGFTDYDTLKAVYLALKPTAESMVRWSHSEEHMVKAGFHAQHLCLFDQFFLFLCHVRQGFFPVDLAVRFSVSQATASRTCITWANYLYFMLGTLPVWPSREAVDELMPLFFKKTFPKTRVVLECTEIRIETEDSEEFNTMTYSHYKGTTTLKSLIGITPSGSVSLVSNLYTGSISDKELTKESGILNVLEPGDEVMADEGFLIKDLLTDINVNLVIPTFPGPSGQFCKDDIKHTRIASLKILVERAIRRIRDYHIFDGVMPLSLCGSVNQLWTVCALLTNFQEPLF